VALRCVGLPAAKKGPTGGSRQGQEGETPASPITSVLIRYPRVICASSLGLVPSVRELRRCFELAGCGQHKAAGKKRRGCNEERDFEPRHFPIGTHGAPQSLDGNGTKPAIRTSNE
jgi:hypothetical protein